MEARLKAEIERKIRVLNELLRKDRERKNKDCDIECLTLTFEEMTELVNIEGKLPGYFIDNSNNGTWKIDKDRNLVNEDHEYIIYAHRLKEPEWIIHMVGKNWVNGEDFIKKYFEALRKIGVTSLSVHVDSYDSKITIYPNRISSLDKIINIVRRQCPASFI